MSDSERDDRTTARHEAGHLVVAHLLGRKIRWATVDDDTAGMPAVLDAVPAYHPLGTPQPDPWHVGLDDIVIAFAGAAVTGEDLPAWTGDAQQAHGIAHGISATDEEADALLEAMRLRAAAIVEDRHAKALIEHMADALQRHRYLAASDVRRELSNANTNYLTTEQQRINDAQAPAAAA